ncbi:MAG: inositol 2-dehydrogenase [Carnobacterium sp.]|nr:inositol 2-dehydrogenase [Carnobacterium sp.]
MNKKIIVGVLGAGRIGKLHVENMLKLPNIEVKTIADPFIENAEEWGKALNIPNLVKEPKKIMNDPEIDVVFICSPTDTHIEMIEAAANAGKNIFCEKPISFSDEETLHAYEVIKKNNVKAQIGFNRRFDKNFARVEDNVSSGKIGDLHILRITSRDPEPPNLDYVKSSGGMFMDMTIHDFDMARFVSGSEVSEVSVMGNSLVNPEISKLGDIDTAIITLKFENGALGVIDNSREAVYGYDQRIEAFGSKGATEIENELDTRVKLSTGDSVSEDQPLHFFLERYNDAYVNEVEQFFYAIRNNEEVPCTFKDGIMAQRIAQAAKESLMSNKPVKVKNIKE